MARLKPNLFDGYSPGERLGFILLLVLLFTAPLPFGGVTQFGVLKINLLAFSAAACAAWSRVRTPRMAVVPAIFVACVAAIGLAQLLALAPSTIERLSPAAASTYRETNLVLRSFQSAEVQPRLSIAPTETIRATLLILAYVAAFVTAARLLRSRRLRRIAGLVLIASALIHVVYAASTRSGDRLHGLFVNPNHLAGYLEIALVVALAAIWIEILTGTDRSTHLHDQGLRVERRLIPIAWRVVAWTIIATAIVLTHSRMGIAVSTSITVLFLVAAGLHRRARGRKYRMAAVAAVAVALVVVGIITRAAPFVRFLATDPRDPSSDTRYRLWKSSLDAWREFPHLGSGLGTFREAFKRVQPADFPGLVEQAHNDALQLLVTGGWIALFLAALGLAFLLGGLIRGWWRQNHREESVIALAGGCALLSLLLHGLVDFNFSIPAIPITLAIVTGGSCAAARYDREEKEVA